MSRQDKIGTHKTTVYFDGLLTNVKYHWTDVVKFDHVRVILDSGGWRTPTTKTRMNQTSNQFGLGFRVFQKDFEWFVEFGGEVLPFIDGMTLDRG